MTERLTRKELLQAIIEAEGVYYAKFKREGKINVISEEKNGFGKVVNVQTVYKFPYHFAREDSLAEVFVSENKGMVNSGDWADEEILSFDACYVAPEKVLIPGRWAVVYKKVEVAE